MHLWFLWFLCWLIAAFLIYAAARRSAEALRTSQVARLLTGQPAVADSADDAASIFHAARQLRPGSIDRSASPTERADVLRGVLLFWVPSTGTWTTPKAVLGGGWMISLPMALLIVFPIGLDLVSGEKSGSFRTAEDEA